METDAVIRKALAKQVNLVMGQRDSIDKLTYMMYTNCQEYAEIKKKLQVIQGLEKEVKSYLQIQYYKVAVRKLYMLSLVVKEFQQMITSV